MSDPGMRGPQSDRGRTVRHLLFVVVDLAGVAMVWAGVQTDRRPVLGVGVALLVLAVPLAVVNFVGELNRHR